MPSATVACTSATDFIESLVARSLPTPHGDESRARPVSISSELLTTDSRDTRHKASRLELLPPENLSIVFSHLSASPVSTLMLAFACRSLARSFNAFNLILDGRLTLSAATPEWLSEIPSRNRPWYLRTYSPLLPGLSIMHAPSHRYCITCDQFLPTDVDLWKATMSKIREIVLKTPSLHTSTIVTIDEWCKGTKWMLKGGGKGKLQGDETRVQNKFEARMRSCPFHDFEVEMGQWWKRTNEGRQSAMSD